MRVIDAEIERYSGIDTTGKKVNEVGFQVAIEDDIFKASATNRGCSVYIFSDAKEWTILKDFGYFQHDYNNSKEAFIIDVLDYLACFLHNAKVAKLNSDILDFLEE